MGLDDDECRGWGEIVKGMKGGEEQLEVHARAALHCADVQT
jgi:hypothetical protein